MFSKGLFLVSLIFICICFSSAQIWRTCVRVIDGDTIVLDGDEKVRLIGVDCPELSDQRTQVQQLSQESYEFVRKLVENKKVRLDYDQNRQDIYGRTLAYVYLEDGTHLNAEIVKQGFGFAYTKYPFKYLEEFREFEKEARENKTGLWANSESLESNESTDNQIVYITKTGKQYHKSTCSSLRKSKIAISLKEAVSIGYTPCSRCKPPVLKK